MKWLKRTGILLLSLPFLLIAIFILYELFGMCANHLATGRQTDKLQINLKTEIPDIQIVDVYSETGNTSGTGNHVDCLSVITFSTEMQESELINRMSEYYTLPDEIRPCPKDMRLEELGKYILNSGNCSIIKTEDGNYIFYLNTSAPFADNIEGH